MEEKIQRLSEGYDFIEEDSSFCNEALEFQDTSEIIISESESKKSPFKLLGRVKGVIAPVGVFSRNGRLYEQTHWNQVLSNPMVQEKLTNHRCFGTLGHADKRIDDSDFREGRISHVCSCLEVREDVNGKPFLYGELDILDTPAGRILKAMYEGGAGLYVSTRGAGKLKSVPGQNYKLVDPSSYFFESVDFVLNPGFLQAKPVYEGVTESKEKVHESTSEQSFVTPEATATTTATVSVEEEQPTTVVPSNEAIDALKGQVERLAKVVEKVVDDVYVPEETTSTNEEMQEKIQELLDLDIPEEVFEDIEAVLVNKNPELYNKIMEASRNKVNAEHGDRTGYIVDYYRFGGKHPYKIVPQGVDYFAASHDSPRFRTLKQAKEYVEGLPDKNQATETNEACGGNPACKVKKNLLSTVYGSVNVKRLKKGKKLLDDDQLKTNKAEQVSEAMDDFLKLLAETNVSDETASEIFSMILNKGDE